MASFKDLVSYYRNYRAIAVITMLTGGIFEIMDLGIFYALGQILNVLSEQPVDPPITILGNQLGLLISNDDPKVSNLLVLLALVFIVTVVRAPIQPWVGHWFHWKISLDTRQEHNTKVIKKILTLPLGFYEENNPGRIAGRVARGISNYTWTYPEIAGQLVPKILRIITIFVIILIIEKWLALMFLISFLGILAFNLKALASLINKETILDRHQENTESRTSEIITNIKTVKAFATEARELARQKHRLEREYKMVTYDIHLGYVTLATKEKTLVQICVFLILLFTLIPTAQGKISLGHFVTTLTVAMMGYAEIDPITYLAEVFARRYASMVKLQEFMQIPAGNDAASLSLESVELNPYRFTGKLEFSQVSFGYDPNRLVLQDINLLIKPCQTVALVGRSGSGKSTFIKLLFRYFDPLKGKILIDGEDIRALDISHYRRRLAIVHQEVDVFNGSLLDNLTYGNPGVSWEEVQKACAIARVEEFIHELPNGYQTVVGERGMRLSGGQKQRLGIARALIVNPDILIFDEATSSLDYESERGIQLAMRSILGTRTTLIIAHRLSTIREADQIVVLDKGRIVEVGNHQELLQKGGVYYRLQQSSHESYVV